MPLRRTRENTGALLHEIVHIYTPNNSRFLAEGLAVYLHTTLAGNPAFPNFRGLAAVDCPEPVRGEIFRGIKPCADAQAFGHGHG
jgi:hypothetical protein